MAHGGRSRPGFRWAMSIYETSVNTLEGEPTTLAEHRGKVLLVVNVASRCGFTPQYRGLQRLQETYGGRGFTVLGFPCNQFMEQEPGTPAEIREFCTNTYHVTFPMYDKVAVNGEDRHPLYAILTEVADASGTAGDVGWNFEKFLVSADGHPRDRFRSKVDPEASAVVDAIEALLHDAEAQG